METAANNNNRIGASTGANGISTIINDDDFVATITTEVPTTNNNNNNEQTVLLNNQANKLISSGSSSSHLSSLLDQTLTNDNHETSDVVSKPPTPPKDENKWQILEGLKDGQRFEEKPLKFAGYMLKRRKRPLKGWHKRYFVLDHGRLSYAKSASDLTKGKSHGSIDVGLSVISTKTSSRRIDIDSEYYIFHLKVKKLDNFAQWVAALRAHRLARQHEINYGTNCNLPDTPTTTSTTTTTTVCDNGLLSPPPRTTLHTKSIEKLMSSELLATKFSDVEINDDLARLQEKLIKLSSLLRLIEVNHKNSVTDLEGFKYKKPRRRFHLRKKKSSASKSVDHPVVVENHVAVPPIKEDQLSLRSDNFLSLSHPSLAEEECHQSAQTEVDHDHHQKPISKTEAMAEFIQLANEVNSNYRELLKSFQDEKQRRLKKDLFASASTSIDDWSVSKQRLMMIAANHRNNSIDEYDEPTFHQQNVSRYSQDDSSVISMSEYFDAEDKSPSDYASSSSSEVDDDESVVTDFSEDGLNFAATDESNKVEDVPVLHTGRRTKLPSMQPSSDISLWSLLCKNIGKDLSKISMPVTINEPLSVLQRLCEELEYCELLDSAATMEDPCQRMLVIAAFAISAYSSSSHRAGHKPFNPLLGETYECAREDKGFRFVAEQVSHHPPISACYADSKNYVFWQDLRVKSKFWGKSMEVIPFATVNVLLKPFNCRYSWNKITTCVHNLFKGERYVENYGELTISDADNHLTCKITFEKAGYWSSKKNVISGVVLSRSGEVVEKIFGRWDESIHCGTPPATKCIWRPGAMPESYQDYYGFSRFAIELNELTEQDRLWLPPTDTRFRPDQRLLEEGNIARAEAVKLELEQAQRDRRKENEEKGIPEYTPIWFRKENNGEETYVFNGKYWEARENHFAGIEFVQLW